VPHDTIHRATSGRVTTDHAKLGIDAQIAARVRALRAELGLSIEALAARSEVSRSMISLIERPTAVLLERLAAALGTTLAGLFAAPPAMPSPLSRRGDQSIWQDPASGYVRRNVSPADAPLQIVDVTFPAGAHVAYETGRRQTRIHHQVWVLSGEIIVTVGDDTHALARGDCLAFLLDRPTAYRNTSTKPARYAVAVIEDKIGR
jgi:transcriptional regulator with XRE-family HTH domain